MPVNSRDGQLYFDCATTRCPVLGCTNAPITLPPSAQTTMMSYTYDPLYRLTSANATGAYTGTFAYTYDAVGNRLMQTANGALTNYAYDNANP
ncbi:MAG: hypothetical protein AB1817_04445 [Chloroflexota bacterium]